MWLAQVKPAFHYVYIQIKYTPAPYVCHALPKHLLAIIMVHHSKFAFVYKRCPTDPQLEEAPPQQKLEAAAPRVEFNESYAAPNMSATGQGPRAEGLPPQTHPVLACLL